MTPKDLIRDVAHDSRVTQEQAARVIAALAEAVRCALSRGESVKIPGIVVLELKDRAARMGQNPSTGEPMQIPAPRAVVAKPVARLQGAV